MEVIREIVPAASPLPEGGDGTLVAHHASTDNFSHKLAEQLIRVFL